MSAERRAILLLLALAVAGQGIRYLVTRPGAAPGDVTILGTTTDRSPSRQARVAEAAHRPLAPGEKIDADRASPPELARLPRVGLSLARRIVADRDSNGPFGSIEGLDRVPGVGPGLLREIGPRVSFSGSPARPAPSAGSLVNLNSAPATELERLPLIGPSKALAIVTWRERHGSFKSLDDLVLVPGVSRRMAEAIRDRVAF